MAMLGYGPCHAQIIDMNLGQRCLVTGGTPFDGRHAQCWRLL